MTADAVLQGRRAISPARALLLGGVAVGVLDLLDAIVFFGARGVGPVVILHSIASGVLGRAAFSGGAATAALGVLLHFVIAFAVVAVYVAASRRLPALRRHPLLFGALYGLAVYAVMNALVVPLSAAIDGPKPLPVLLNGLLIHVIGVGIPSALAARAAYPSQSRPSPRITAA